MQYFYARVSRRRDPLPSAKERSENILRLERMVAGGYPAQASDLEGDHLPKAEAKGSGDSADRGNEPSPVRCGCTPREEINAHAFRRKSY